MFKKKYFRKDENSFCMFEPSYSQERVLGLAHSSILNNYPDIILKTIHTSCTKNKRGTIE